MPYFLNISIGYPWFGYFVNPFAITTFVQKLFFDVNFFWLKMTLLSFFSVKIRLTFWHMLLKLTIANKLTFII